MKTSSWQIGKWKYLKQLLLILSLSIIHFGGWMASLQLSISWLLESGFSRGFPLRDPTLAERVLIPARDILELPLGYWLRLFSAPSNAIIFIIMIANSLLWGTGLYLLIISMRKIISHFNPAPPLVTSSK